MFPLAAKKQVAMLPNEQKPKRISRKKGEAEEDLPGKLRVACVKRGVENLGGPEAPAGERVGWEEKKTAQPEATGSQISPQYSETGEPITRGRG